METEARDVRALSRTLTGRCLHTGTRSRVHLRRKAGPVRLKQGDQSACLSELQVVRADHGVCVQYQKLRIELVEHFLAALAGLSVFSGVELELEGQELPLLDGGALEWAHALEALRLAPGLPPARVARAGEVCFGDSIYRFEPAPHTTTVELSVEVEFAGFGRQVAEWSGKRQDFLRTIADARTFGFAEDAERLQAQGRARHVDPNAVLILQRDGSIHPSCRPPRRGELAQHKLLDLLGDFYLSGALATGRVSASRPGHQHNHKAARAAFARGLLEPIGARDC